jgi:hypothetical protein
VKCCGFVYGASLDEAERDAIQRAHSEVHSCVASDKYVSDILRIRSRVRPWSKIAVGLVNSPVPAPPNDPLRTTYQYRRRIRLFERDKWRCRYCARRVYDPDDRLASLIEGQQPNDATVDHVLPRSRGGKDTDSNRVTACRRCNTRKGNRTNEEAGLTLLPIPRGDSG